MKTQLMMKKIILLAMMALTVLSCANRPKSAEITVPDDLDPEYAVNLVKAGEKAPDFVLTDLDGKTYTLKDFPGKNRRGGFLGDMVPGLPRGNRRTRTAP